MTDFRETHFALLDLQYRRLEDCYHFIAITDVPCHLFMRMTVISPRKHVKPSPRRGTVLYSDIRYCFVVYIDYEQTEAGDTLTHTWEIHDWPHCERRWLYFYGTMSGVPSVSETAIFRFHFAYPPPEMMVIIEEPWTYFLSNFTQVLDEIWSFYGIEPPAMVSVFDEHWTMFSDPPPAMVSVFDEHWTYFSDPPPNKVSVFDEHWTEYYPPTLASVYDEHWTA